MYYNEEVKSEFIRDYLRSKVVAATSLSGLFNKTEMFETQLGKDCSQFTKDEILNMYRQFNAKSAKVLENYTVYLKHYTAFRLYHGQINTENEYLNLTKDIIKSCLDSDIQKQMFLSREQLDDIENELLNYTDKAIVEALWHGISGKSMCDLVSLNRSMLSDDKRSLIFSDGRIVLISQKLSEYLDKAFDETEYLCYGNTLRVERMVGYDTLYKERANAYQAPTPDVYFRWVYRRVQNYRKHLDIPLLTMKTIQASGLWYFIQQGISQQQCSIREFLASSEGKALAVQYGYKPEHYVDVIIDKFADYQG